MLRNLGSCWRIASVVVSIAICAAAYAQDDKKERVLMHKFLVTGDQSLVKKFQNEYKQRFGALNLSKYCVSSPEVLSPKGDLSITCKPSSSTAVISDMTKILLGATKGQEEMSSLSVVVSAEE
jgi:hypothetical protein